jgi:hypothetical protein
MQITINEDDPFDLRKSVLSCAEMQSLKKKSSKVLDFYLKQNELILEYLTPPGAADKVNEVELVEYKIALYGSLAANMILFASQMAAAILSGSLVLFATTADAFMDLTSSTVLIYAGRLAGRDDYHNEYPAGKEKYKTAGIIVFSTLMSTLALQLLVNVG